MSKKSPKKCAERGKERADRAPEQAARFSPLNLEVRYPDTAILLLKSPERPILLAAAAALSSFAAKGPDNALGLFDLGIVDSVLNLIRHDDLFTRRFAMKLLALMSAVPNVRTHLLQDDSCMQFFTETYAETSDGFLREFSSRVLAELTSEHTGSAAFLDKYPEPIFLYDGVLAVDPDVKRNCAEIIDNLLGDYQGFDVIARSKDFNFIAVYNLFKQPYPVIQEIALEIIERIVTHNAADDVQEIFRQSEGLTRLLEILTIEEWNDLHSKVLDIIALSCENPKTADLMNDTNGTKRLFDFMENTINEILKFKVLSIFVCLAESLNGRKVLYNLGLVPHLILYTEATAEPSIQAIVCQAIAKLTQYYPAAQEISEANPLNYVLSLLNNAEATWATRLTAIFTLKELFTADIQNCSNFLAIDGLNYLMAIMEQPTKDVPTEMQVSAIQAISKIADYTPLTRELIRFELFSALCSSFEPANGAADEVKIACCEALSRFPVDEESRRVLIHARFLTKLYHLIIGEYLPVPVREAAVNLLLVACSDPELALLCVHDGYLAYLLKNRFMSQLIPTWQVCIQALFSADLPMKFGYTGRLSLQDVTKDGFYVMRRSGCPFPILEELLRLKVCPLEPIYVVNFSEPPHNENDDFFANKQSAFEAARDVMRRESIRLGLRVSEGTINSWLELKFGRLRLDRNLMGYLEQFRGELAASTRSSERSIGGPVGLVRVSRIAHTAKLLGEFVARQMAGTGASNLDQQLDMHLHAIKISIQTSVIPLGMLRVGSYLERALLFKVMADRLALPASLVRGRYGRSWVEIAVPVPECGSCNIVPGNSELDISESCSILCHLLPTRYLQENFIVDLMEIPGDLIPIGSVKARFYLIEKPPCDFFCCK